MTQLLVSISSAAEAEAAIDGGADVIDVKDPSRGALGRADDATLTAIRDVVGSRRPLSAALGELADSLDPAPPGFQFVKCGLAGLANEEWAKRWLRFRETAVAQAVIVAYADWQCAKAPPLDDVVDFACRRPGSVLLVDTCCKDESRHGRRANLLDWTPLAELAAIVERLHREKCRIALAGSLGLEEIVLVSALRPDWIAVRGAACIGSDRNAAIDGRRVRRIKSLLGRVG